MKQIDVKIMEQSYLLSCPEGQESRMLEAVERVDSAMTRIRDAGKVRARERIAVLAALNLAFEVADREVAELAAKAKYAAAEAAAASAASAANGTDGTSGANGANGANGSLFAGDTEEAEQISGLLKRIDQALGDDGRLL